MSTPSIQLHSQDSSSRFLAIGGILFDERYLLDRARSSNFCKRTPREINVCNLTAAICVEGLKGSPSYNDLAANIAPPQCGPSRQAVHQRMGPALAAFIGRILEKCFWLRWSIPRGRLNALRRLGVGSLTCGLAYSGLGAWRIARLWQMSQALSNKRLHQYGFILPWSFGEAAPEKC